MIKYIARRLVQAIPTVFGVTIFTFLIISLAPGGPTAALLLDPNLSSRDRENARRALGLDDPLPVQYLRWLIGDFWWQYDTDGDGAGDKWGERKGVLLGEFGYSIPNRRPVLQLFGERLGATLELGVASLLFGLLLGVPIGIIAATARGSLFDNITRVLAVVVNSVPIFWLGLILILIFGSRLGVLPMGSRCPTALQGCPPLFQRLNYILLPMIVLGAGGVAGYSRYLRASMLDVIGQDYIRTAKSKGLRQRRVWFTHGARNALIPLATFLGPAITNIWAGAFITEQIFSWPGIGFLTFQSINAQDFAMLMAVSVFSAVATIFGFLLSDILYALIDPRIRFS